MVEIKNIFKPWILVSTGILFNILSAIVTHYFIDQNNQRLDELNQKAGQLETLIESQWRIKTELDRSQEFLLLLLTLEQQAPTKQAQVIQDLVKQRMDQVIKQQGIQSEVQPVDSKPAYSSVITTMELARINIINRINDTYLEKLNIDSQHSPIKQRNTLLFTAAIFLQLTGLILVLSRDLKIN